MPTNDSTNMYIEEEHVDSVIEILEKARIPYRYLKPYPNWGETGWRLEFYNEEDAEKAEVLFENLPNL